MKREILFRGKKVDGPYNWVYGSLIQGGGRAWITKYDHDFQTAIYINEPIDPETIGQFTGLYDKEGNRIFEGDIYKQRYPDRETQTHYGDNIPLGQYTEPLEPVIREEIGVARFVECGYLLLPYNEEPHEHFMHFTPIISYDLNLAKEGFEREYVSYKPNGGGEWEGEEGDLQYLLCEYNLKNEQELIKTLGVEVIGNMHDNPELLKD